MRFFTTAALLLLAVALCTHSTVDAVDTENIENPQATKEQRQTKRAVEKGLAHLASIQNNDGSWRNSVGNKLNEGYQISRGKRNKPHLGVTAICCMAFMANGNTPNRGKYSKNVLNGLNFVLGKVSKKDGWISFEETRMYSHAFCTMFLAEVYGMTKSEKVRNKLRNAIKFIMDSQNGQGSWRYIPHEKASDMSICVCQLQALRAAANVGVVIARGGTRTSKNKTSQWQAIKRAKDYVRNSYIGTHSQAGAFMYQIGTRSDGRSSFALTAAGIVALQSLGEYDTHEYDMEINGRTYRRTIDLRRSIRYLQQNRPDKSNMTSRISRSSSYRLCDYSFWYGHYYAAQAMFQYRHVNKQLWENWNKLNQVHFLKMQQSNGAWVDEVGSSSASTNAYATGMACLILSIPRGYLPILQA